MKNSVLEAYQALQSYPITIKTNEMLKAPEIGEASLNDQNSIDIKFWLAERDIPITNDQLKTVLHVSKKWPGYHPYDSILKKHKKSKPSGIIEAYSKRIDVTFGMENETDFAPGQWPLFFKKWYVAMIRSGLENEPPNDMFIVIYGSQGKGKTWFITHILPESLSFKYCTKHALKGDLNKDRELLLKLSSNLIVYEEEMGFMNTESIDSLKAIMSDSNIRFRPLYSNHLTDKHRLGSFIGSSNKPDHLRDSTGNRRMLVVNLNPANENPISFVDPKTATKKELKEENTRAELMVIEALELISQGFDSQLTKKEVVYMNSQMTNNTVDTKEDGFVSEFMVKSKDLRDRKVIGKHLLSKVMHKYLGAGSVQAMNDAMIKAEFKYQGWKVIGGEQKGYALDQDCNFFKLDGNDFYTLN